MWFFVQFTRSVRAKTSLIPSTLASHLQFALVINPDPFIDLLKGLSLIYQALIRKWLTPFKLGAVTENWAVMSLQPHLIPVSYFVRIISVRHFRAQFYLASYFFGGQSQIFQFALVPSHSEGLLLFNIQA